MGPVSDEEFQVAYENTDNRNIIRSVCGKYSKQLSRDELRSCGMIGLWNALQKHDPKYKRKFTTSLWKWVTWECLREVGRSKRFAPKHFEDVEACFYEDERVENRAFVVGCLSKIPKFNRKIIKQRFLLGMTFEDIGQANGLSKETARQRYLESIDKLKEVCSQTSRCIT